MPSIAKRPLKISYFLFSLTCSLQADFTIPAIASTLFSPFGRDIPLIVDVDGFLNPLVTASKKTPLKNTHTNIMLSTYNPVTSNTSRAKFKGLTTWVTKLFSSPMSCSIGPNPFVETSKYVVAAKPSMADRPKFSSVFAIKVCSSSSLSSSSFADDMTFLARFLLLMPTTLSNLIFLLCLLTDEFCEEKRDDDDEGCTRKENATIVVVVKAYRILLFSSSFDDDDDKRRAYNNEA
mmetsp:Transcript_5359/g.18224  ORF Transcript_5359/g.18224 Transcript_5359/m.18224 type:complete len:235 (+) Transcript_5359:2183-2887(+)